MLEELNTSLSLIVEHTKANALLLLLIGLIPCFTYVLNLCMGRRLLVFGIWPRRWIGLPGIFLSPLLHLDGNHLFFNLIPLLVLSDFMLLYGLPFYLIITLLITLLSGLLIWCLGKPGIHVGASALITGYWGFIVIGVYQQGTLTAIIIGLVTIYYFAGIFFGIFPRQKGVSWEGHLFGLISGLLVNITVSTL